jgi:hypothetical protein
MFVRVTLPRLNGSPSVWSVAVLFLQTMLLGDYAYSHILMRAGRRLRSASTSFSSSQQD